MVSRAIQRVPRARPGSIVPGPRPVMLATLSVRVDASAEAMAIESALEAGVSLIVANMLILRPYPATVMLAREGVNLPREEDLDEVRATASRAPPLPAPRGAPATLQPRVTRGQIGE